MYQVKKNISEENQTIENWMWDQMTWLFYSINIGKVYIVAILAWYAQYFRIIRGSIKKNKHGHFVMKWPVEKL